MIVVDVHNAHVVPFEDAGGSGVSPDSIYSTIVYSAKASDVTDVWVDGRRLLRDERPTTLDENAILAAAAKWRTRIRKSLEPAPKTGEGK